MPMPKETILDHIRSCRSVLIASLNEDATPHTSYAPFVMENERIYLLVSEAARHSRP